MWSAQEITGIYIRVCLLKNNMHKLFLLYMLECGVARCLILVVLSSLLRRLVSIVDDRTAKKSRSFFFLSLHVREGLHKHQDTGTHRATCRFNYVRIQNISWFLQQEIPESINATSRGENTWRIFGSSMRRRRRRSNTTQRKWMREYAIQVSTRMRAIRPKSVLNIHGRTCAWRGCICL